MPVNTNSFLWPAQGTDPREIDSAAAAVYTAGQQPIASYDNFVNRMLTEDITEIGSFVNDHVGEHEAGGPQEIDLDGLGVGSVVTVGANEDDDEFVLYNDDDEPVYRFDIADERIRQFPQFATLLTARTGLATGDDIERTDGDVIYDHSDDYFHRARFADEADYAANAGSLDGFDADDYIKPGEDTTITGKWTFEKIIKGDLDGTASHAEFADEAAFATFADEANHATTAGEADYAEEANNAQFLRGMSPEDLIGESGGGGGGGGGWINIDIDIDIDIDTNVVINKNLDKKFVLKTGKEVEGPFDQCKLRIYHESADSFTSSKSYMRMHINNEKRSRYNYAKAVTNSTSTQKSIEKVKSNWAWPVAHTDPQEFSVTEYDISSPSSIGNINKHYPKITATSTGVNEDMSGVLTEGHVETNYDKIDQIDLESRGKGAAKVEYWARNFD